MKSGGKVVDFGESDPFSDFSPVDEFKLPPTPTKNTNNPPKSTLPTRKSFLNFGDLDKKKSTDDKSDSTAGGSRFLPTGLFKANDTTINNKTTGFEGFTLLTNSDFNAEKMSSDVSPDITKTSNQKSSFLPARVLSSKTDLSPTKSAKSPEKTTKNDLNSDDDVWATLSSMPVPSSNKVLPERKTQSPLVYEQSSPKRSMKIDENDNFDQNRTEILTKKIDFNKADTKEKMVTQSEASLEFEENKTEKQVNNVMNSFASDMDNIISKFKRLFMNEFTILMRDSPQTNVDNIELFLQDISNEINEVVSTPKVNSSAKLDTLGQDVSNIIDDNVKLIKSTIMDVNNIRKTQIERQEIELRAFLRNLKNLQTDYKNSTAAVIAELEQEHKSHDLMTTSESTRILEFQKQIQNLKIRQIELENTVKDQCEQIDEIEQSFQKLEMNQQYELMKNSETKIVSKSFLSEVNDCLNEIQNSVRQEPIDKVIKQFSSMERKLKNESEMFNLLVIEMKRTSAKSSKAQPEELTNQIVASTKKKLERIKRKKEEEQNQ